MLGAIAAFIIDRKFDRAALYALAAAVLAFFGFINGTALAFANSAPVALGLSADRADVRRVSAAIPPRSNCPSAESLAEEGRRNEPTSTSAGPRAAFDASRSRRRQRWRRIAQHDDPAIWITRLPMTRS